MPTTDPGSDLIFSTDDEITDASTNTIRYATLPQHIKRHLLSSELQRRYEIGNCLGIMPPELVITAPSNKDKKKIEAHIYKPEPTKISVLNSQRKIAMMPLGRTRWWQNLKTSKRTLLPYKPGDAKNIPLCRPLSKKDVLNKEDLNIQLSLKKKIWAGFHQPDETSLGIDRSRPLSWMAPHTLRDKKTANENNYGDLNFFKLSICNNSRKADNKALFSEYNRKLLEWQILSINPNNSPYSQEGEKLNIKEDPTIYTVKQMENYSKNKYNEISNERKPKRKNKTSKILAKISKPRNNILTSHHSPIKQPINQNKSNARSYKCKSGGLVATAVQIGVSGGGTAAKKNKKSKSVQNKLKDFNSYNKIFLPHNNNDSKNNKNNLPKTTAATNTVQKAKTKLKDKKLSSCAKPEVTA